MTTALTILILALAAFWLWVDHRGKVEAKARHATAHRVDLFLLDRLPAQCSVECEALPLAAIGGRVRFRAVVGATDPIASPWTDWHDITGTPVPLRWDDFWQEAAL